MKNRIRLTVKMLAFVMSVLILIASLPVSSIASAIYNDTGDTSTENTSENADIQLAPKPKDVIVLEEDEALREENIKHFKLSDGTTKAVVYTQPVHYMDSNGKWIDIDNALTLNGSEYSTNNKSEIKFANKSGSSGLVSIKDGKYKIDFTPSNTNKVNVEIENPQENNSRKFDDVKALRNLISKATYSNIYNGIDIEYILTGNNIKENIIVNSQQESYVYSFELKLNKLTAELSNGSIILSDSTTGENMYVIPAPYMYDANGVMSTDVEYSLVQNNKWKYTFTVTANSEWINADERTFPVTIDPTIIADNVDNDTFIMLEDYDYTTSNSLIVGNFFGMFKDVPGFMKFNTLPDIQPGTYLVQAKVTMHISYLENTNDVDFYLGVFRAQRDWVTNGFADVFDAIEAYESSSTTDNYNNYVNTLQSYFASTPENSVQVLSDGPYEWDITSLYKDWKNGTANNGICVKAVGLPENENANVRISTIEGANTDNLIPPQIELTYTEPKGIDDDFAIETTTLGTVGNSYVNLFNGNLTYINNLTTIENQVLPYEINMVYNSTDGAWTTSFDEKITLFENPDDNMGNNIIRYLWHDADGTTHYFTPYLQKNWWGDYVQYEEAPNGYLWAMNDPVVFYPEDDIDYVLTKNSNGEFILKGYDGTQKLFDINGRLSRICDAQGNMQYFSYVNNQLALIDYKTFDNKFITQVRFTYDDENLVSVYNFTTKLEISLAWGTNGLSKIVYNDIDNTKDNTVDIFYVENANMIDRISDSLASEYIKYAINAEDKISAIQKYNSNNVLQTSNNILYNDDNTICTDLATDLTLNTSDDVRKKYTFDERGRKSSFSVGAGIGTYFSLISTYEYDDEVLPDDVYYIISYSSNINNELYVDESEANIVRYDIGIGEEEYLNFSNLPAMSTNVASNANEATIESYNNEASASRSIILPDERQKIANTMQEPYNSICYIETTYNNLWNNNTGTRRPRTFIGSGFLAGDNLLITAGHVIYGDVTEPNSAYDDGIYNPVFPDEIIVYPGSYLDNNGNIVAPYGSFHVETCYIQKQYYDSTTFEYDWGICILESNIGNQVGWFDISITSNSIVNEEISVIGYPGDKDGDMYYAEGVVLSVTDYRFLHNSDTVGGSSGSPVFIKDDSAYIVKGIHTSGSSTANGATRINSFIYTFAMNLKSNE